MYHLTMSLKKNPFHTHEMRLIEKLIYAMTRALSLLTEYHFR